SELSLIPYRMTWSSAPWRSTPILGGSASTLGGGFVLLSSVRTALSWSGRRGPRKGVSSVRCWPISSCTTRSTYGCNGSIRASGSSGTRTMQSSTRSEEEARSVLDAIRGRLAECGLELHPEKTRVVYCKDGDRRGKHEQVKFDFLGYSVLQRQGKEFCM